MPGFIENDVDQRFARLGIFFAENLRRDFDEITLECAPVPLCENVGQLVRLQIEDIFQNGVGFADQLNIAVLDAVVHHLDVMAGPVRTHVTAARLAIHLGCDLAKNRSDHVVGFARSTRHHRRTLERSFFSAGNAAANKVNSLPLEFLATALRIGEKRIPSVDNDVASFQERGQFGNHLIDRFAGFDHDHRLSRPLQRANEILHCRRREDVFPFCT